MFSRCNLIASSYPPHLICYISLISRLAYLYQNRTQIKAKNLGFIKQITQSDKSQEVLLASLGLKNLVNNKLADPRLARQHHIVITKNFHLIMIQNSVIDLSTQIKKRTKDQNTDDLSQKVTYCISTCCMSLSYSGQMSQLFLF